MVTVVTEVVIHSEDLLFMPGGDVWEWCEGIADELKTTARAYCPPNRSYSKWRHKGTGATLASIKSGVVPSGPERLTINLSADSDGAPYLIGGTAMDGAGWIYSDAGWIFRKKIASVSRRRSSLSTKKAQQEFAGLHMTLPRGIGPVLQLRVRGQRKNPFITDAYDSVRYHHDALPELAF
jgi:hypothetical protein